MTIYRTYLLVNCSDVKFEILQVINTHAFSSKFSESRDYFHVTSIELHNCIQMQTIILFYFQAFFEYFRSIFTISYSNVIGKGVKFMLIRGKHFNSMFSISNLLRILRTIWHPFCYIKSFTIFIHYLSTVW